MITANRHSNPLIGLIDKTSRLHGRLKSAFAAAGAELGLNEMEVTVLNAVTDAQRAPTVPQIGRALGHPRQVIQRAANSLIKLGLIEALDNPDHKKAVLLAPTSKGKDIKRIADARGHAIATQLLESVDAKLVVEANDLLETLRKQIDAHFRNDPERKQP